MQTHTEETHHADVESVQQVEGQGSDEVDEEPCGDVVDADGAGVVHDLTRRAHKSGSKVQQYVCRGRWQQETQVSVTNECYRIMNKLQSDGCSVNQIKFENNRKKVRSSLNSFELIECVSTNIY